MPAARFALQRQMAAGDRAKWRTVLWLDDRTLLEGLRLAGQLAALAQRQGIHLRVVQEDEAGLHRVLYQRNERGTWECRMLEAAEPAEAAPEGEGGRC